MNLVKQSGRAPVLLAVLLAGCSLAPVYERPALPVAHEWPGGLAAPAQAQSDAKPVPQLPWQTFFRDARLKQLIGMALEHNRDLRVATLNIERARALYDVRSADRVPNVNLAVGATRQLVPDAVAPLGHGGRLTSYSTGLGLTAFELDLFGRVRSLSDAALGQFAATEEAQRAARISLIAQVAFSYEALVADAQLLALSQQTLNNRTAAHERQIRLHLKGAISEYDLRQSESLLEAAKVAVLQTQRQRALDENALTLLVGHVLPAGSVTDAGRRWDDEAIAALPAGLPSDLLTARPDIRQQEALLRAANANIGAARAAFFPRISLTGAFGSASNALSSLFDPGSGAWTFQHQLSLPILDGGRNRATLNAAVAERDIAVAQYDKTVQSAFREVADALAGHATLGEELRAVRAQEHAEQVRHDLARLRYESGEASYLEYLDAQRALFFAQQQTIHTGLAELQNRIGLYKSLGGGWNTIEL